MTCQIWISKACESASAPMSSGANQAVNPIADSFAKSTPYGPSEPKKLRLDRLVAEMLCADLQPYTMVEKRGFTRLMKGLDPRYVIVLLLELDITQWFTSWWNWDVSTGPLAQTLAHLLAQLLLDCSALLASLARSAALSCLLTRPLTRS